MLLKLILLAIIIYVISVNVQENLINLTTDHHGIKKKLRQCCDGDRCLDKPKYLHKKCEENKETARQQFNKRFAEFFFVFTALLTHHAQDNKTLLNRYWPMVSNLIITTIND